MFQILKTAIRQFLDQHCVLILRYAVEIIGIIEIPSADIIIEQIFIKTKNIVG